MRKLYYDRERIEFKVGEIMQLTNIPSLIASELRVKTQQVEATIQLLDEGNTIPFIARYRKEVTGELNEEYIRTIVDRLQYLRNLVKRQEEILASIEGQGKLTPELTLAIQSANKLQELEDLYLPYRPKKRTRAQIARERGLEPLAQKMLVQQFISGDPLIIAADFINLDKEVTTAEDALSGACDIIAEIISEQANIRNLLRKRLWENAEISSQLAVSESEGKDFLMYKDYQEPVKRIPSHRVLAINRGEAKDILKVHLLTQQEANIDAIIRKVITGPSIFDDLIKQAITDGYKRLLFPSLEREIRSLLTENAEKQAIRVFGLNLRQRLLEPPLAGHTVMGLDPGYRTGCKMAVIGPTGATLETGTLYITSSANAKENAMKDFLNSIKKHKVTLIAIGNGTASYETEEFTAQLIQEHSLKVHYLIVSEAGASVYSASKLAREELPDLDVSLRGAVSIARRVQDPLAELVKIDPKSIGVGQYQHDVNQKELESTLNGVVESAVNHIGVELNTASPALLNHVAGINGGVAKNIVAYRNQNGAFKNRKEILKVPRLGQATFLQCAGFLRLKDSNNPLDNTPVHPESYHLAEAIVKQLGFKLSDLNNRERLYQLQEIIQKVNLEQLAQELKAGQPTIQDILMALAKPGRDPRENLPSPMTRKNIVKLSDIVPGTIVKGSIQNVTDFGAFVDIGIKINGLIHRSELSFKPFRHPLDVISVGEIIECVVLSVDEERGRIALSLKQMPKNH